MTRISLAALLLSASFALNASAQTPPAPRGGGAPQTTPAKPATPAPATQTPPATPAPKPATPPPPFPADSKIGFVNMQLIVAESKLGKSGQDRMKKLHDDNQTHLAQLAKGIQDQQQKITTQTGVVTDAALQALKRELERMQLDAQAEQQKANSAEQNLNEDLLNDFSSKTMPIIDALRTEKGLWIIFGVQETDQGNGGQIIVASANPGLDLSQEVIKRLDAKFPAPEQK